jgi:hypothetical protein
MISVNEQAVIWKRASRWMRTLVLALAALFGADVFAATYYVTTTGNDSGAGTQSAPWRTIQKAVNAAVAGDVVMIGGGTYTGAVTFANSGVAGKMIVLKNVAGQTPIIDGSGVALGQWGALVSLINVGYIRLEGLEIRNASAYSVYIGGESHHLELVSLNVHNNAYSGIYADGPDTRPGMNVITNCKVHDNQMGGITIWRPAGGYYRIEGNEVWGNIGVGNYDGIQVGGGSGGTHHVVVKNNIVHDNGQADIGEDPIDVGGHGINHHYLVEGNYIYGGKGSFKVHSGQLKSGWYTPGTSGHHIARFNRLLGVAYVAYEYPDPIAMYNNTFAGCGQCVLFYGESSATNQNLGDTTFTGGDTGRMNWKNNLFFRDTASKTYVLLQAGPSGSSIDLTYRSVRFQSNLYRLDPAQAIVWNAMFGAPVDAAAFANYKASNAPNYPDTGSVLSTATWTQMFAGTGDLHLAAGSPAIDKGTALTKATNAGSNSTTLVVDRATYFHDGFCVSGECLNTPDTIVIGNTAPVAIVSINAATNTITLAAARTWSAGTPVTLPYNGVAPDIGAFEYGNPGLPAPSNMRLLNLQ